MENKKKKILNSVKDKRIKKELELNPNHREDFEELLKKLVFYNPKQRKE